MKNRAHGLDERGIELAKLLMTDCMTMGDYSGKVEKLRVGKQL